MEIRGNLERDDDGGGDDVFIFHIQKKYLCGWGQHCTREARVNTGIISQILVGGHR